MREILLFGAGKSSTCLIDYLIENANTENWHITIADVNTAIILAKTNNVAATTAVAIDIHDEFKRNELIGKADIVISLMPPALHFLIAQSCIVLNKNLLTASYVDEKIKSLRKEIEKNNLLFICEMGLDPGIDHMSAMQLIDDIKEKGGSIVSFKSHCGGLVAPESDDNPWHYKISWNPRNVVMAGSSGAIYKKDNEEKKISYENIFENNQQISVEQIGALAYYPNRDSLSYISIYQLTEASEFIRTTLRYPSFCLAWNHIVRLQLTSDNDDEHVKACKTFKDWINIKLYLFNENNINWKTYISHYKNEKQEEVTRMFEYLGIFSTDTIPSYCKNSADILQYLLETKLALRPHDKDMIVMIHEIEYLLKGQRMAVISSLVVKGEDHLRTAMAKTVGLPLGIVAKLILNQKINLTGLRIPIVKEIYEPVLNELKNYQIHFIDNIKKYNLSH